MEVHHTLTATGAGLPPVCCVSEERGGGCGMVYLSCLVCKKCSYVHYFCSL